ncbi:MAG: Dabb family protein [Gammaproteobacteria bacterium]|nr:Dabb family protein [Gammaproteobacteria bacterium]
MIRHTILFKLKAAVPKREIERVFTDILSLTGKLEGVTAITGGTCHFHEVGEHNFSHGFSIDFDNKAARDAFVNDPITWPVKEHLISIAEGGNAGIIGFDFRE